MKPYSRRVFISLLILGILALLSNIILSSSQRDQFPGRRQGGGTWHNEGDNDR